MDDVITIKYSMVSWQETCAIVGIAFAFALGYWGWCWSEIRRADRSPPDGEDG